MGLLMHHFLIIEKASPRAVIFREDHFAGVIAVNNKEQTVCSGWYIVPPLSRHAKTDGCILVCASTPGRAVSRPELLHIPAIGTSLPHISRPFADGRE